MDTARGRSGRLARPMAGAVHGAPPPIRGIVLRPRLFRLLDDVRGVRLVWLHGPPGSGKTSLVASYVRARSLTTAWCRADPVAKDPEAFAADLERAVTPPVRRNGGRNGDVRSSLRRFFRRLAAASAFPDLLVLDDFDGSAAGSPLAAALAAAIEDVPARSSLLVLSRELPPPPFARLRLNGEMRLVGGPDLGLTVAEARALGRAAGGTAARAAVADTLHRRTRGWVGGFGLLLRHSGALDASVTRTGRDPLRMLHDYFASEVLATLPAVARKGLARSAVPPFFTPRVFRALVDDPGADEILDGLRRRHLFLEERSAERAVYEYHGLFREFLLARLPDVLRGEDPTQLRVRAAHLLLEEGFPDEAVDLCREARAWPAAAAIVADRAAGLAAEGRLAQVDSWLRGFPDEVVGADPALACWRGTSRLAADPADARGDFERSFALARERGDGPVAARAWCGVVESFLHEWSDASGLDPWLERLEEVEAAAGVLEDDETAARLSTCAFAALALRRPDDRRLAPWLERAGAAATSPHVSAGQRTLALFHLAFYWLCIGDVGRAALYIDLLRAGFRGDAAPPLARVAGATVEAIHHWFRGDGRRSLDAVAEGLRVAAETGARTWDYQLLGQGVYAALVLEDVALARSFLERLQGVLREERKLDLSHFHYLHGLVACFEADYPASRGHAQRALELARESGAPFSEALNRLLLADLALQRGEYGAAGPYLDRARAIGRGMGSRVLEYTARLVAADLALARRRDASATQHLRRALAIARSEGFGAFPWIRRDTLARLLGRAVEAGIEPSETRRLVERANLLPPSRSIPVECWPRPLEVFAFGSFEVRKEGQPVEFGRKVQKRPLDVLKVMVALGGVDVPAARVGDVLWPDLDGDAARQALATTLHRLRQLIDCDRAVTLHDAHLSLDPKRCWVDVFAFEDLLAEAERLEREEDRVSRRALAASEAAFALYRGNLLAGDEDSSWAAFARERLRSKFLRHVLRVGEAHENTGDPARAIDVYLRGLEVDDLAEEFHLRLMRCYRRLGRQAEGLATYERCRRTLAATLGVSPSAAVEELHQSLLRGS